MAFDWTLYPATNFNELNLDWILENTTKQNETIAEQNTKLETMQGEIDNILQTTIDYDDIINKPSIEGETLQGNKSLYSLNGVVIPNIANKFNSALSYNTGDYVFYNGNLYKFKNAHSGAWDNNDVDLITVSEQFKNISKDISDLNNVIYTTEVLPLYTSSANWALIGNGLSRSYSGASLRKYKVTAGQKLYLKLFLETTGTAQGVYQFQNNASVPGSGTNNYLIGTPVTHSVDEIVTVPTGATYLIVSCLTSNTTNIVDVTTPAWEPVDAQLNARLRKTEYSELLNERLIASHGGSTNGVYAMNSIPGIKTRLADGDKYIELDVRFTSDGVAVLFHDEAINSSNIDGYTGSPIYIGALTYAQLQTYNLPLSSGKIPTLKEAMLLCKKCNALVEIDMAGKTWKSDASTPVFSQGQALQMVINIIDECNMRPYTILTVEYGGSTNQIAALMPITTDIVVSISNRTTAASISAISTVIEDYPIVICSIGTSYTDSDLMNAIKTYGCKAKAFSIETNANLDTAFEAGVDYCLSYAISQNDYEQYVLTI